MSTPLLSGIQRSSRPSSSCASPVMTDCSTLLRSLWTDLSSDVCAVSTCITSWLSSWNESKSSSSSSCTLSCHICHISRPHRLCIDDYLHWLRHHRSTWLHTISRPHHQRRRATYLLHDDESDDERDDTVQDEREETLIMSYQDYARNIEKQRQAYVPQTCLCQRMNCQQNITCRNTTLMVAACAGLYERASLRHPEFVAPRHLGVATDDVVVVPPISPLPSTTSSCDSSSDSLSVPSSPHRPSQWSDDDSDVDMRSSSPMPSPLTYPTRMDSDDSMDMMDSESDVESEQETEIVDGEVDMDMIQSKSALRRRSSSTQQTWLLPGMSRSRSLQRLAQDTSAIPTPMTNCGLKTRRLVLSTPSTPKDVMDQLWSIKDTTQLQAMKQSFREMHTTSNVCAL